MIARGWATVELERAARELGALLRPGAGFAEAPDCELLGARCLVGELADTADGRWVVLLEPATEGRLSLTLARHGEGWVASWEAAAPSPVDDPSWSAERPGPFGPERVDLRGPAAGPHRLLATTATIEP